MSGMHRRLLTWIMVCGFGWGTETRAQPALPGFTGDPVVVVEGVDGDFEDLRAALRELNQRSPRDYYAVLVGSTEPEATAYYLDRLVDAWAAGPPGFDAEEGVVTLVAVEDRQVSMLAGTRLRRNHGLTATTIDQDLVQPFFSPRARAGDLSGAVQALAEATEQWLQRHGAAAPAPIPVQTPVAPVAAAPTEVAAAPVAVGAAAVTERVGTPRRPSSVAAVEAPRRSSVAVPVEAAAIWWGLGGLAALGVCGLWWLRVSRHRRAERAVREPFQAFSARVVNLLDRVEALSRRHQLLPFSDADYQQPMAGRTAAHYDQTDQNIRQLRRTWLEMMSVHDQIKLIVDNHRRLSPAQMEEVRALMSVQDRMEEAVPLEEQCLRQLEDLEQAHERAAEIRAEIEKAAAARQAQIAELEQTGYSVMPYEAESQSARDLADQGAAVMVADPMGSSELLSEASAKLKILGDWLSNVLMSAGRRATLLSELDTVAELASQKRREGLSLREEEGNPDPMIAQGRHELEAAWMALNRGETEDSRAYLDQAEGWAREAAEAIRGQEEARLYCEGAVPARTQRAAELQENLRRADDALERLRADFAEASWHGVSVNPARAAKVLEGLPALLERARADASPEAQRYFHAEDLLVHVEQQQEQAAALLDAVGARLEELREERTTCERLGADVEQRSHELEAYLAEHRKALGPELQALAETAQSARRQTREDEAADRPNWPLLRNRLELAMQDLDEALETARQEVREYQEVQRRMASSERELSELESLLSRHREDRPLANRLHVEARRAWEAIRGEANQPGAAWDDLAARLRDITGRVDQARRLAEQDISLARQVEEAIRAADRDIQQARAFYETGVRADADAAERGLQQARRALREQEYEAALDDAGEAAREAQAAISRARRLARERRRIQTQQRLAQTASVLVQAAAAYAGARQGSRRHLSMPTPPRRVSPPPVSQRHTFPSRGSGGAPRSSQSGWGGGGKGPRSSQSSW